MTPEGGHAIALINKTGAASVRGTVLKSSTTVDKAVEIASANEAQAMGVMEISGIPDGSLCWVVVSGPAYVLLQDATAATVGYWVRTSITVAGRADATIAAPPGGGVPELDVHMTEIGHSLESVTAGTDKLVLVHLHFN